MDARQENAGKPCQPRGPVRFAGHSGGGIRRRYGNSPHHGPKIGEMTAIKGAPEALIRPDLPTRPAAGAVLDNFNDSFSRPHTRK